MENNVNPVDDKKTSVMKEMFGVFGKPATEVKFKKEEDAGGGVFFNPDPKNMPNNQFVGMIKFLPNLHDLENGTVSKVTYWVPEGAQGGFRYDSPKSISKYENCPVSAKYWEMDGSDDARIKALAKKLSYNKKTFALIQILKDIHKPENDGKFMIWELPVAIQKKIEAKMYPSKAETDMGSVANNVFDPINGEVMTLKIGIKTVTEKGKTAEYRDYDTCEFNGTIKKGIILPGTTTQLEMDADPAKAELQQQEIIEAILSGPNLQDYAYKAPTEEILKRVDKALNALTGLADAPDAPAATNENNAPAATTQPEATVTAQPAVETVAQPAVTAQPAVETVAQPAVTAQPAATSADDANAAILAELGIAGPQA